MVLSKKQKIMQIYKLVYTRENCLIAIQIWEEHQVNCLKQKIGKSMPLSIFDAYDGVVRVYYHEDIHDIWNNIIVNKANDDPSFVPETMKWYGEHLDKLEKVWHNQKLSSVEELFDLFELTSWAWVGLSISYYLPGIKSVSKNNQNLGMALRQRSVDFLELTDHVIQNTLRNLFPNFGDLVKYLAIEEIKKGDIPSKEILKERQNHYIYYGFKIYTKKDVSNLAKTNGIKIQEEIAPEKVKKFSGQIAMAGKVVGKVRLLSKKADIPNLQNGEILVTAMTTPDYIPAMKKAGAFVTDEGGITCHAAIVAREFGKPCIIGTKIATRVLKTGDLVEVDANDGVIKII